MGRAGSWATASNELRALMVISSVCSTLVLCIAVCQVLAVHDLQQVVAYEESHPAEDDRMNIPSNFAVLFLSSAGSFLTCGLMASLLVQRRWSYAGVMVLPCLWTVLPGAYLVVR